MQTFKILTCIPNEPGSTVRADFPCYAVPETSELVVHRTLKGEWRGSQEGWSYVPDTNKGWHISHRRSGNRIAPTTQFGYATRKEALAEAAKMASAPWDRIDDNGKFPSADVRRECGRAAGRC